jgi:hypothetical protein
MGLRLSQDCRNFRSAVSQLLFFGIVMDLEGLGERGVIFYRDEGNDVKTLRLRPLI